MSYLVCIYRYMKRSSDYFIFMDGILLGNTHSDLCAYLFDDCTREMLKKSEKTQFIINYD